jgi:hypothetical protein
MKKIIITFIALLSASAFYAQITGTGANGQVTYFTGTSTVTGNNNLFTNGSSLGVGTNTLSFRLNVTTGSLNDGLAINETGGSAATIHMTSTVGGHHYGLFSTGGSFNSGQGGGGRFVIYDYTTGFNRLIIDGQGYFGIGLTNGTGYTLTPKTKLHIQDGSIKLAGIDPVYGAPNIFWGGNTSVAPDGQWGLEYNSGMGGMNFWRPFGSNAGGLVNNVLFLADNGNIGFNTNTPSAKLEINALDGSKPLSILSNRGDWTYGLHYQHQGTSVAHKAICVSHNGAEIFTVNTNGLVAIGNNGFSVPGLGMASPPYSLVVGRGILTERLKVALSTDAVNWSDYVFDSSYVLNSTDSVEQYVNTYKHLPNVPSSSEVYSEGLDVAQMDAALLRQIEELWLHVIELKKENEELKTLVNEKLKQ